GQVNGQVGIGVEKVLTTNAVTYSHLVLTGTVSDYTPLTSIPIYGSGDFHEYKAIIPTGSTSGTISITFNGRGLPGFFHVFSGLIDLDGTQISPANAQVVGSQTENLTYTNSNSHFIEILINPGVFGALGNQTNIGLNDGFYHPNPYPFGNPPVF